MSKDAVFPSSTNYWYSLSCFPTTTRRRRHLSAGLPSHPPAYALRGLAHSRYFGTSLRFFGTDVPNSQHNLTKLICLFHVYRRRFQMNMRTFSTLRIELMFIPRLCHLTDGLA